MARPPGRGPGGGRGRPADRDRPGRVVPAGHGARPPARDRRGGGVAREGPARRRPLPLRLLREPRRGLVGVQHHPPRRGARRAVPGRARPHGRRRPALRARQPDHPRRLGRLRPVRRGRERRRQRAARRRPHAPQGGDRRRALRRPRPAAVPFPAGTAARRREHPAVLESGHAPERAGRRREVLDRRGVLRARPHARRLPRRGLGAARAPGGRVPGDAPGRGRGPRGPPGRSLGGLRSGGAGARRADRGRGRLRALPGGVLRVPRPPRVAARRPAPQPLLGIGRRLGTVGEATAALGRLAAVDPRLADLRDDLGERSACLAGILLDRQVAPSSPNPRARGAWFADGYTQMDDQQHAVAALLGSSMALR